MNGLELGKAFYFDCVQQIITDHIPALDGKYAAGVIGTGSDVIGNDDALSRDHEWGPKLLLFLEEVSHQRFARPLDYTLTENLPETFQGFSTKYEYDALIGAMVMTEAPGGKHRITITTVDEFMQSILGFSDVPKNDVEWLLIPEQRLLEFTSGELFSDPMGDLTDFRQKFAYFPENVWKYRLAYLLETIGWELDLVPLCGKRGDHLSMHLNTAVSVERIMRLVFFLNKTYCPGYAKWLHREFSKLDLVAGDIEPFLQDAFISSDYVEVTKLLDQALERIYGELKNLEGMPNLPPDAPRKPMRESTTMDTQQVSQIILESIQNPLGKLKINGVPYGGMDQWISHEDIVPSPKHLRAMLPMFKVND